MSWRIESDCACLRLPQLAEDEFLEAENIEQLSLGFNEIESLNSSLQRIRALTFLNLTANRMTVFSLQEIHGLQRLKMVDLSYNRIGRLVGRMEVRSPSRRVLATKTYL